jgi:hypothetical protein
VEHFDRFQGDTFLTRLTVEFGTLLLVRVGGQFGGNRSLGLEMEVISVSVLDAEESVGVVGSGVGRGAVLIGDLA